MRESKFIITLKWGALLGAGLSLIKLATYYAGTMDADYPFGPISDLLMVIAFVVAIYMAIKEIRDNRQDGVIRFAPAFGYGVLVVFIAYAVMVGYLLVHYTHIEKDGVEKNNRRNMELAFQRVQKEQATDEEVSRYYESVAALLGAERDRLETDSVCGAKLDSATQILLIAYKRQLVEKPHASDDPSYRLDSFQLKADELLYRCTAAVLANANDSSREYIANLPALIDATGRDRVAADPVNARFEIVKPTVPQSDSPVMAAFAYSLSILLYGLLLNIFVALFLYRNEKRKCSLDTEETSENTEETSENTEESTPNS
jgi:uncharacterized membrane protein